MKAISFILLHVVLLTTITISAQNVGINVSEPSEPLEVGGMIFSSSDGFKFPDSSVQTRAAVSLPASDVSDKRGIIIIEIAQIPGPTTFQNYHDVVRAFDFCWGASRTITYNYGGGTGTPPEYNYITVLKEIDRTSVPLLERFFNVSPIDEVNFYLYQFDTVQSTWDDYYHIRLETVYVSGINQFTEFAGSDEYRHLETITFSFRKIEFDYDWEVDQQYQYDILSAPTD